MRRIFTLVAAAGLLWGMGLTGAAVADGDTQPVKRGPLPTSSKGALGVSCPEGTMVVGGGFEADLGEDSVAVSEAMEPNTEYPHYTTGEGETGWWVQNGEEPQDITVFAKCAPIPLPGATVTENCEAGGVDVLLDNSERPGAARILVKTMVGDKVTGKKHPTVPAGETETVTLALEEDVETRVFVVYQGDILYDQNHVLDCVQESPSPTPSPTDDQGDELTEVVPVKPDVRQPTCDVPGAIVVPDVEGVLYRDGNGKAVEPGTYEVAEPGDYPATAEPDKGFEFPEGAVAEWILTVDEAPKDCETPTPTPTGDTVPAADDSDEDKGGALPLTGSPLRLLGAVALALIAAGGLTLGGLRLARMLRT